MNHVHVNQVHLMQFCSGGIHAVVVESRRKATCKTPLWSFLQGSGLDFQSGRHYRLDSSVILSISGFYLRLLTQSYIATFTFRVALLNPQWKERSIARSNRLIGCTFIGFRSRTKVQIGAHSFMTPAGPHKQTVAPNLSPVRLRLNGGTCAWRRLGVSLRDCDN